MDLSTVLSRNPEAAFRIYDGQATVVLPGRSEINVLNEIGSLIWERLDGQRTVGEILQAVLDAYEIDSEQARNDTLEFLSSLQAHGMVT
jgi:coenzyme PQQ synthesis protein D (PqqD)